MTVFIKLDAEDIYQRIKKRVDNGEDADGAIKAEFGDYAKKLRQALNAVFERNRSLGEQIRDAINIAEKED